MLAILPEVSLREPRSKEETAKATKPLVHGEVGHLTVEGSVLGWVHMKLKYVCCFTLASALGDASPDRECCQDGKRQKYQGGPGEVTVVAKVPVYYIKELVI